MATIHLMVGFMGFGKTTLAKQLAEKIPAVRLTHDEFMVKLYRRNMPYDEFHPNYDKVDKVLWNLAEKIIKTGTDVIMDYGFWSHSDRENAYQKAKKITDNVLFHYVYCDMFLAKERILARSAQNSDELYIREDEFDTLAQKYEPWNYHDDYPVIVHNLPISHYIGNQVLVKIDRQLGSKHPKYGFEYPLNYGYVPFTKSGDCEEIDAYVLMENKPLEKYVGRCIGIVHRTDDNDDKLIVVPEAYDLADELIEEDIAFQEKWFKHILIRDSKTTKTHFGIYGSIIKNGKILLIKKARGPYTGLYDLPGGSPEKGESYLETLRREIVEETGCEVIKAENERFKSIIFSDFTVESGEKGVLQHNAVLYDVEIKGTPKISGDGLDSNGAVWVDIKDLTAENATPYALMAADKL
ncbi:MAG: AAA family ATPase [Alphaproteobacteria bacterium]|nr:AAA family ATPase [Alphaproteobacteria bacterium]